MPINMRFGFFALITVLALPVIIGFIGTLLPSLYYFPALGETVLSLRAYADLFSYGGLKKSLILTLTIGWGATLLSFAAAILLSMNWNVNYDLSGKGKYGGGGRESGGLLSLFLAVPHSAFAIGFLFLLIPNGWLLRLLSPWLTGFDRPPTDWLLPDLYGITALVGLSLKEVPFLLLVWWTAARQFSAREYQKTALMLGYSARLAWLKLIFPQIYRRSRLAMFAVLAYSLSVVDVPLILSPSPTPVLSVHVLRWSQNPDTAYYFITAAAALLQLALVIVSFILWWGGERLVGYIYKRAIFRGTRNLIGEPYFWHYAESGLRRLFVITCGAAIITLPLFAFAHRWRFPESLPYDLSWRYWERAWDALLPALWNSLSLAVAVALLGLLTVVLLLEMQNRLRTAFLPQWRKLLFLPLLLPQVAFLLGVQVITLHWQMPVFIIVAGVHLLFVIPYMLMVLSDSYMNYDERASIVGMTLGRSPWAVFVRIKLAMLLPSLVFAFAVGFAVSIGQYLPTVFASAGRFATLTTEAVTLAAGGNRGSLAVFGLWQSLLPLAVFWLALLPHWRKGA